MLPNHTNNYILSVTFKHLLKLLDHDSSRRSMVQLVQWHPSRLSVHHSLLLTRLRTCHTLLTHGYYLLSRDLTHVAMSLLFLSVPSWLTMPFSFQTRFGPRYTIKYYTVMITQFGFFSAKLFFKSLILFFFRLFLRSLGMLAVGAFERKSPQGFSNYYPVFLHCILG